MISVHQHIELKLEEMKIAHDLLVDVCSVKLLLLPVPSNEVIDT